MTDFEKELLHNQQQILSKCGGCVNQISTNTEKLEALAKTVNGNGIAPGLKGIVASLSQQVKQIKFIFCAVILAVITATAERIINKSPDKVEIQSLISESAKKIKLDAATELATAITKSIQNTKEGAASVK